MIRQPFNVGQFDGGPAAGSHEYFADVVFERVGGLHKHDLSVPAVVQHYGARWGRLAMQEDGWKIASPAGDIRARPERADDEAFRFSLFCQSRPDDWAALGLKPSLLSSVMQQQFHAQTVSYRAHFSSAAFDILEHGGERIGRIVVDRPGDRIHVVDHALVTAWRNRGIGRAVMRALMAEAAAAAVPVRLKVASGNDRLLWFYAWLGFSVLNETEAYLDMAWYAGQ